MLSFLFPPICPLCAKELLDKGVQLLGQGTVYLAVRPDAASFGAKDIT